MSKKNGAVRDQYRDRLFQALFGQSKENALSLYNAVNRSNYTNPDDLEFNTIADAIFLGVKNDVSFLFSLEMNLYEHQSTPNPNMPLRGLIYLAHLLDGYVKKNDLWIYGSKLIRLPTPHYIVFYNGEEETADQEILKLSDAFEKPGGCAEMTAVMYNINYGRNRELMERCDTLNGYAALVEKTRVKRKSGLSIQESVRLTVDECIREGILSEYLKIHKAEVVGMLLTEYDEAEHMRRIKEEGREEGFAEGEKQGFNRGEKQGFDKGIVNAIRNLMESTHWALDECMDMLKVPDNQRDGYAKLLGHPN